MNMPSFQNFKISQIIIVDNVDVIVANTHVVDVVIIGQGEVHSVDHR